MNYSVTASTNPDGYLLTHYGKIKAESCDYNGHLNEGHALVMLSLATDTILDAIQLDAAGRERLNFSAFTIQNNLYYRAEGHEGQDVFAQSQLLSFDEKRLRMFHRLIDAESGAVLVELECLMLGVDMAIRKSACWPEGVSEGLAQLRKKQQDLPRPDNAGRAIEKPVLG
ncbi:thioesterase family protein [Pontibacterium sp.]|uniref:thioesterase family protein n=1 Tax=Pontibacterium sp. TaxID=2036026 RepID=UPI0035633B73